MKKLLLLAFLGMLCLGLGGAQSCATGGGGSGGSDDDASGDDDTYGNLTWQNPPSSDSMEWEDATAYCDNLSLDGHDDWRLPTISELRSLIRGCDDTMTGGACGVTDDCLDFFSCCSLLCCGCKKLAGPGSGGAYWPDGMSGVIEWYWSSSPTANGADVPAWVVNFGYGILYSHTYNGDCGIGQLSDVVYARCVRP